MKIDTLTGLIDDAQGMFADIFPGDIAVDTNDDFPVGYGKTYRIGDNGKTLVCTVGMRFTTDFTDSNIPDADALKPLIAMFHEVCGHAMQEAVEFKRTTTLSKVLAVNHFACKSGEAYYGASEIETSDRYFNHPHEIAAQFMGLKCAHAYLCASKGKPEADRLIMTYEKERIEKGNSFLGGNNVPKDVNDLLSKLNKRFRDSVHAHREYEHGPIAGKNKDLIAAFDFFNPDYGAVNSIESCEDGLLQDMRASAITNAGWSKAHGFYENVINVPAYKSTKINIKSVFQDDMRPFHTWPEKVMLNLNKLKALTDKMDRDRIRDGPGLSDIDITDT